MSRRVGAILAGVVLMSEPGCLTPGSGIRPPTPFAALGPGPLIIAHRGGSLEAPENTLAGLRHGVTSGADWQELDVTLTRDNHIAVIHDDDLERTTNGHGLVEQKTLAELTALRAGQPRWTPEARERLSAFGAEVPVFGSIFVDEHVPSLDQALALPRTRLMIEMKKTSRPERLADLVVQAVHRARATERVALGSFEYELLNATHQLDPSLPLIGVVEDPAMFAKMLELPLSILAVETPLLEHALSIAPPGVAVWVWTVYTVDTAIDLADRGAHGLITDVPAALVRALRPEGIPSASR